MPCIINRNILNKIANNFRFNNLLISTISLMLRMICVTSSLTPAIVRNSYGTPSMRTEVTAAPGMDDSSVRRSELPSVYPKPGSRGSMTNRERRLSSTTSSESAGRCRIA